jgi:hypothetical protein
MAEPVAQQSDSLQLEVQNLQAQLQTRSPITKDLSIVALVPKWSSTDKAIPLHEFFETLESTDCFGNWTQEDMLRIAVLKLTDSARSFYNGTLELHDQKITWVAFKTAFRNLFRNVRTDQYLFTQHQMARQRRDEAPPAKIVRALEIPLALEVAVTPRDPQGLSPRKLQDGQRGIEMTQLEGKAQKRETETAPSTLQTGKKTTTIL